MTDAINESGGEAAFVKVDISKSDEVQNMVRFTVDTFGKLDVAVNNAALNQMINQQLNLMKRTGIA